MDNDTEFLSLIFDKKLTDAEIKNIGVSLGVFIKKIMALRTGITGTNTDDYQNNLTEMKRIRVLVDFLKVYEKPDYFEKFVEFIKFGRDYTEYKTYRADYTEYQKFKADYAEFKKWKEQKYYENYKQVTDKTQTALTALSNPTNPTNTVNPPNPPNSPNSTKVQPSVQIQTPVRSSVQPGIQITNPGFTAELEKMLGHYGVNTKSDTKPEEKAPDEESDNDSQVIDYDQQDEAAYRNMIETSYMSVFENSDIRNAVDCRRTFKMSLNIEA